ncbi:unnamed protein product, partial [Prorocentrum cordatum]
AVRRCLPSWDMLVQSVVLAVVPAWTAWLMPAMLALRGSAIEHAVGMGPLVADSVGCAAGDGHSGSEGGFVSFLDDFSVAAVACAARGPKSGVEPLLDWAEARALGVRLGSA